MPGSPGKDQPGWHLAAQLSLLHSLQVDVLEPHGRFESLDAMQALRMSGTARTALTGLVLLATARGIAALVATRIIDPGGEDGRRAAGGDERGDADQRHAKGSSTAVRQPIRAASDPNHVKEWSSLKGRSRVKGV
jgi:hypothetical protein